MFTEYAKCFRTIDKELNECIFLEDLSIRDFVLINHLTEEVTADHARLLMQALGKFHALSFAVKDQQSEKFKELSFNLTEMFLLPEDARMRQFLNKKSESFLNLLDGDEDAQVLAKMKMLFKRDAIDIIGDCLDLKSTGAASVITHGDVWQNNLMFRCDADGKPIEICFLDWQVCRHVSPIIDIVYFMFCCTTKELRDLHYENLLKIYYESLAAHTKKYDSMNTFLLSQFYLYSIEQSFLLLKLFFFFVLGWVLIWKKFFPMF